jgi:hypothetical protein
VSAGPFGGSRVVQSLLPVTRELGLVTIFWDVNIGSVAKIFDENGGLADDAFVRRADKFIGEMIWMTKVLRHGREEVTIDDEAADAGLAVACPACGAEMTHHADKLDASAEAETMMALHQCPGCGAQDAQRAVF